MPEFYWIALKTETKDGPVFNTEGPFNTAAGRDKVLVERGGFWSAADIVAKPFTTEGRKKTDALSTAVQIFNKEMPTVSTPIPQLRTSVPDIQVRQNVPVQQIPRVVAAPPRQNTPDSIDDIIMQDNLYNAVDSASLKGANIDGIDIGDIDDVESGIANLAAFEEEQQRLLQQEIDQAYPEGELSYSEESPRVA